MGNYCNKTHFHTVYFIPSAILLYTLITVHLGICPLLKEWSHTACATTKKTEIWFDGTVSFWRNQYR